MEKVFLVAVSCATGPNMPYRRAVHTSLKVGKSAKEVKLAIEGIYNKLDLVDLMICVTPLLELQACDSSGRMYNIRDLVRAELRAEDIAVFVPSIDKLSNLG